ncbi:MAG: corrinoid protein [Candidatus Omnitrophota bacterium]|nr:MAG: corrinoid protein [Candidatus Omnitrophota bacterium]
MGIKWDNIKDAIFTGNIAGIPILVKGAICDGLPVQDILNKGLIAGMSIVGEKFKSNEIFVPEVLISAKAMQAGLDILEPLLVKAGVNPMAKIVIGTSKGDLHDIGKNLVSMMFKGGGFSVIDLGIDVAPRRFIDEAIKSDAEVIAMSSLITTSMPSMKATINLLKIEGLNGKIKTIIGGAPVTQEYADEIGADGYADNASSAIDKVKELLGL